MRLLYKKPCCWFEDVKLAYDSAHEMGKLPLAYNKKSCLTTGRKRRQKGNQADLLHVGSVVSPQLASTVRQAIVKLKESLRRNVNYVRASPEKSFGKGESNHMGTERTQT